MTGLRPPQLGGRRLILRGDASATIGTGHLMRMLALAQGWLDSGGRAEVLVAEAPDGILERYAREGIVIERLPGALPAGADIDALIERLHSHPDAVAVIDGPTFDTPYLDGLADVASRVAVIDDMALLPDYPVALVLNQNAHADRSSYPAADGPRYLLGLAYCLLRREFRSPVAPRPVPVRARHVLAMFGGADPAGMTARTIRAVAGLPESTRDGIELTVVVGSATPVVGYAGVAAGAGWTVAIERDVTDIRDRMAASDLAVTSGGSTVWELARIGVPALVVETAGAEHLLAGGLAAVGLFDRLGPAADLDDLALGTAIARRLDDVQWRTEMARQGPLLLDGHGTDRVVAALASLGRR